MVPFIPMAAVSEDGTVVERRRHLEDLRGGYTYFEKGDILLAKITPCFENGKIAYLSSLSHPFGFGSTEFHVLRPTRSIDPRYLYHALRSERFRRAGVASMTGSAGQQRVPARFVTRYRLPLPDPSEQRRIAEALDKMESVQRNARAALSMSETLLHSTFVEIFGDPVINDKNWEVSRLEELVQFIGGGTPSRTVPAFFNGGIPWASSKDIVAEELWDTQEHITKEAIDRSATRIVQAGSILIVVKSKILLHRLPVAITRVPLCFNQDIKALQIIEARVPGRFLARHLRVGQRALLDRARGANTEGLTLEHLRNYRVIRPPMELLNRWDDFERRTSELQGKATSRLNVINTLTESLIERCYACS
jgi:type I restriction enzyme, S subunit